jgi:hypothetical protein
MNHWFIGGLFIAGEDAEVEAFKRQHLLSLNNSTVLTFEGAVPLPEEFKTIVYDSLVIDGQAYEGYRNNSDGSKVGVSEREILELARRYGTWRREEWTFYNWGSSSPPVTRAVVDDNEHDEEGQRTIGGMFGVANTFPHAWLGPVMDMHDDLNFGGFFSHAQMGLEIYIEGGVVRYVPLPDDWRRVAILAEKFLAEGQP